MTDTRGKPVLSIEEAMEFLGVSRASIYRLLKRNLLEKADVKKGRLSFITLDSLDAYSTIESLTPDEMARRLVALERKVEFLMAQKDEPRDEMASMQRSLRKHHPEMFMS